MRDTLKKQHGFTLVEVTIILLVLVILSTIMLPQLGNYNRLARFVKAREDLGAICSQLKKMIDETMMMPHTDPQGAGGNRVGLMVGPGRIPQAGFRTFGTNVNTGGAHWALTDNTLFNQNTNGGTAVQFQVGTFAEHLQYNDPGVSQYPMDKGPFFGWRGPYFDAITADPWGQRYAVNTFGLHVLPTEANGGIYTTAVVCYSAGPDGGIDTVIDQPADGILDSDGQVGWQFGKDDQGVILSAGGPF